MVLLPKVPGAVSPVRVRKSWLAFKGFPLPCAVDKINLECLVAKYVQAPLWFVYHAPTKSFAVGLMSKDSTLAIAKKIIPGLNFEVERRQKNVVTGCLLFYSTRKKIELLIEHENVPEKRRGELKQVQRFLEEFLPSISSGWKISVTSEKVPYRP